MRLLLLVTLTLLSLPVDALAYFCSKPSEPYLPNGSSSNVGEMETAQDEVRNYMGEMKQYVECLQDEIDDAVREANDLQSRWNSEVSSFNN